MAVPRTEGTVRLTKRVIDAAKYEGDGKSMFALWDDEVRGLGLRVYPTGRKSFVFKYRHLRRQQIITIAKYGDYTLEQARNAAEKMRGKLADGEDPLIDRAAKPYATVRDLGEAFIERYSKPKKLSWEHDRRRLDKKLYPHLGSRVAASITRADMKALQEKLGSYSIHEADHTLNLFSKMVEWGKEAKIDSANFHSADTFLPSNFINPCRGIEKFKKKSRERWVRYDELPRLVEAINQAPNVYIRGALLLYLLTGIRKAALLRSRWQDFDRVRRELRVVNNKGRRTQDVPLNEPAMRILFQLEAEGKVDGNPFIFVGHVTGRHLVNIDKPWRAIRERAHLTDVHLHDLRRTVGSYLAQSGTSLQHIGAALDQSNTRVTEIYARLTKEQSRLALDSHAKKLIELTGTEFNLLPPMPEPTNTPPALAGEAVKERR